MAVIDHIDGPNRLIYLRSGVTEFHPVDDVYRETRSLRRTIEDLRKYDNFIVAKGNESKGGGKATARFAMLIDGTKIIPYDEVGLLTVLGDIITDEADTDPTTVVTDSLINKKDVFFTPPTAEIVYIEVSAIAQELEYGGIVYLDPINGESGTGDHVGTMARPSNNLADTISIAASMNIDILNITGALSIESTCNISNYTLIADRSLGNSVVVAAGALTDGTYFENLTVSGVMNGTVRYTTCVLGEITNFDGGAKNSLFTASIYFTGTGNNYLTECDTYVTSSAVIELHINAASLNIIRGRGRWGIFNKTSTDVTAIDLAAGFVKVDISCDTGEVHIGGISAVQDDSDDGCIVKQGSLDKVYIADAIWDAALSDHNTLETTGKSANEISYIEKWVYIDEDALINGNGKEKTPFNITADAVDFAEDAGIHKLRFLSDATLERNLKNWTIEGVGLPTIDLNDQDIDGSEFTHIHITGIQRGSMTAKEVVLLPGISNLKGVYKEVALISNTTYSIADNAAISFLSVSTLPLSASAPPVSPILDFVAGRTNQVVAMRKVSGTFQVLNMDDSSNIISAQFSGGGITFEASCTAGTAKVVSTVDDAIINNGNITVIEKAVRPSAVTNAEILLDRVT